MHRIAGLLLFACALHAQLVDGTLTDSVTHAPIPNVIVTLLGPVRYNATTDETGAFHIGPVQPGKYMLNIVQAGYVLPPSRRAFQVDSDLRLPVELDPLGRVEGLVRYPNGRPAPRAQVWLAPYPNGAARAAAANIGAHFVFDDLTPGRYILYAAPAPGDPKPEGEIWATTYFPSTTDRDGAEPIPVTNTVVAARDVRLRSVNARRIRGTVLDEAGRPAADAAVTLSPGRAGEQQTLQTREDGGFDFVACDGDWRVSAARKDGEVERRGSAKITVSRHDVENVEIRLARPFRLPVVIDRDDDQPAQRNWPSLSMVYLFRVDEPASIRPSKEMLEDVYPGRYLIHASGGTPGVYLESIKLGAAEVYGSPVDLWDGSGPIRVKYRKGAPLVRGSVEAGEGATVAFLDADETTTEAVQMTAVSRGGTFQHSSLRPGDYYVIAVDRNDPAVATPAFRRAALPSARKIHLEKGESVFLDLKVTPWPI
jgi:hypothetical protein